MPDCWFTRSRLGSNIFNPLMTGSTYSGDFEIVGICGWRTLLLASAWALSIHCCKLPSVKEQAVSKKIAEHHSIFFFIIKSFIKNQSYHSACDAAEAATTSL